MELVDQHNSMRNSQRALGPVRLKWRLLVARGLKVLVVNAWEWQRLSSRRPEEGGMSNRMAYLARKLQPLLGEGAEAGDEDAAAAARGQQEEKMVVAGTKGRMEGVVRVEKGRGAAGNGDGLIRPVRRPLAGGRPKLMRDWVLE